MLMWFSLFLFMFSETRGNFTSNIKSSMCPISSLLTPLASGYFSYPIDLYRKDMMETYDENSTIVCRAHDTVNKGDHRCHTTSSAACPVSTNDLFNFIGYHNKGSKSIPCDIVSKLFSQKYFKRILVLGGSETRGADTIGCCCCHVDCPIKFDQTTTCRWSSYLQRGMRSFVGPEIEVINLARGGWTSQIMADNLRALLYAENITIFSTDLIILDFSVNDACGFDNALQKVQRLAGVAMDRLIRNLITVSVSTPSIMLLETYPESRQKFPGRNYSYYYRDVANYYKLPVWSFADMSALHQDAIVAKTLQFYNNKPGISINHPPWHVHLFLADILMSAFIYGREMCSRNGANQTAYDQNLSKDLPPYKFKAIDPVCDESKPFVLAASAEVFANNPSKAETKITMTPNWQLKEDVARKPGWISIQNNSDIIDTNELVFHIDEKMRSINSAVIVSITYLNTYENCGVVSVRACDLETPHIIDSVPPGWETRKISVSAMHNFIVNATECNSIVIRQIPATTQMERRKVEKFKINSVNICYREREIY